MQTFTNQKPQKLSKAVLSCTEGLSFSAVMKLIRERDIKVNGVRVKEDVTVGLGDDVVVYDRINEYPEIKVVYEDTQILVIDKPSCVLSETVFERLKAKYGKLYFIHRLDRNTSGIMIFAKTEISEKELLNGFKTRAFTKKYLAEVFGVPKKKEAVLCAFLKKNKDESIVKIYDKRTDGAVPIKTGYKVLEIGVDTSFLEVTLFTGKTHQIRAHLAHIGHFIVGDGKYGDNAFNKSKGKSRQVLKAYSLTLNFNIDSPLYYLNGKVFKVD